MLKGKWEKKETSLLGLSTSVEIGESSLQGVFAGCVTSQAAPPLLSAKGSSLIRTSITLSICSQRIQLL